MLQELHITNYALIDRLDVAFHDGLNIITGETGAGKSIMLGALSLIFGNRSDSRSVKKSDKKSVIECTFDVSGCDALREYCAENDIEWPADSQFILRREISPSGRTRSFVNDTPASLATLGQIALFLVDIHSQHHNLLLSQPRFQLDIIDAIAGNADKLEAYGRRFAELKEAIHQLKATRAELKKTADNADFMRFQLDKINSVNPQPGEVADLESMHEQMSESVVTKSNLERAMALIDGEQGIAEKLFELNDIISEMTLFDTDPTLVERLGEMKIEIADISESIADVNAAVNSDPRELEYIENRLNRIRDLMDRFNTATEDELLAKREQMQSALDRLESAAAITKDLEANARKAMAEARAIAVEISRSRTRAAEEFAARLKEAATPLGMKNLRFEIRISESDLSPTGIDKVDFLFAFNKNQQLMPVADSASGGEISRLMLCIKAIVADRMELPSILFDEIDTGVSGEVAARMGRMMHDMSASLQTIVITHLPQVAAAGDHHFKVYKEDDDTATHTRIRELTSEERIHELAVMLGGDNASEAARLNAISLLKNNGKD